MKSTNQQLYIFLIFHQSKSYDRAWHHNIYKLSCWDYILILWRVMSSWKVIRDSRVQDRQAAAGCRPIIILMLISLSWCEVFTLWWSSDTIIYNNSKYFGKSLVLTFQLWMSTEIWNFHYYLMKSIIILVLTMDNWHFVRRAQFNYVWILNSHL